MFSSVFILSHRLEPEITWFQDFEKSDYLAGLPEYPFILSWFSLMSFLIICTYLELFFNLLGSRRDIIVNANCQKFIGESNVVQQSNFMHFGRYSCLKTRNGQRWAGMFGDREDHKGRMISCWSESGLRYHPEPTSWKSAPTKLQITRNTKRNTQRQLRPNLGTHL
jgi:hypothetical protein